MLKNRICTRCGAEYNPDGVSQRYCLACRPLVYEEQRRARYERRQARIQEEREKAREQRRIDHGEE